MTEEQTEQRSFLPLGSVVLLKGSVKKLIIVSRASIVNGSFFDYGAFLYPEGMIDANVAYFSRGEIQKVVHEGYEDEDNELVLEFLKEASDRFQKGERTELASVQVQNAASVRAPISVSPRVAAVDVADPFASVRDLGDDDEWR